MGCCNYSRRKKSVITQNATYELILEKVSKALNYFDISYLNLENPSFDKIDLYSLVNQLKHILIVISTIIEDNLIESTAQLSQEEKNKIYSFVDEIEHLIFIKCEEIDEFKCLFEEYKEICDNLHSVFQATRASNLRDMTSDESELIRKQRENEKLSKKKKLKKKT